MLDNDSALLNLADSVEEKHPVNADHSDIVKFDNQANETYKHVCSYLRDYLEEFRMYLIRQSRCMIYSSKLEKVLEVLSYQQVSEDNWTPSSWRPRVMEILRNYEHS